MKMFTHKMHKTHKQRQQVADPVLEAWWDHKVYLKMPEWLAMRA